MTDRIHSLSVVLERNIRTDDIKPLIGAILQLRGVLRVSPHVADADSHMAESRARAELLDKVIAVLGPKP